MVNEPMSEEFRYDEKMPKEIYIFILLCSSLKFLLDGDLSVFFRTWGFFVNLLTFLSTLAIMHYRFAVCGMLEVTFFTM